LNLCRRRSRARWFLSLALVAGEAGAVTAQESKGRIEGRVQGADGNPIVSAQVLLVGTAFAALTDPRGFYFINNVPAGPVAIQARYIGFRPVEVRDLRILAGQTITQDFALEPQPIELEEIRVMAADNPLVPRDEVTTKQRAEGEYVDRLPIDRLTQALALEPGVVANSNGRSLSIRGGRPEETVTYIDGVPVTGLGLEVATNAVQEASVTTGAGSAEFGNFQSGIVSIQTRQGGTRYSGSVSYETDEPFGASHGIGFNRIEASFGGPIWRRLTFFVSGMLDGAQSRNQGREAEQAPVFVSAGVDTTVTVPSQSGTTDVDVLRFAVYRGECETFQRSRNPGIASNYGRSCHGIQLPGNALSDLQLQAKLSYTYGTGSRLALTFLHDQLQGRQFNYGSLYNPQNLTASHLWANVYTLNWTQNLTRQADRALALDSYLSYQQDREIDGPLTTAGERATRDPFGGFLIKPLDFRWGFDDIRMNQALVDMFLLGNPGWTALDPATADQYTVIDQYRNDAYGLPGWADGGGPAGFLTLYRENRVIGRSNFDWQLDRYNRLKAGGEFTRYSVSSYSSGLFGEFADLFLEHPIRWNLFAENRIDLGDLVLVGGVRYDWYDSRARRSPAAGETTRLPGFDPLHPRALFVRDRSHHYLSPHVQVAFPVSTRTNFRFSYAHQVQSPSWGFFYAGVNTPSPGGPSLGADLDFGKTISFEFGIRHSFSDDMVLDLSAYNKDNLSNTSARMLKVFDPVTNTDVALSYFTNADFGNTRGLDVRLDRRIGALFNGMIGYTFQDAKNTGSDPFSNVFRGVINVGQTGGSFGPPPQAIIPTEQSRPHTLTGQLALQFPNAWRSGTAAGAVLQNVGLLAVFRFASGTAYTPCQPGLGNANTRGECVKPGPVNSARLPMFKQFDLRVTKGFKAGRVDLTGYLDARNLFDFTTILNVWPATRGVVDGHVTQAAWETDSVSYAREGQASGVWRNDGSLDLGFGGAVASGCGGWVTADQNPSPPNCVYLVRAEERFGNGDHVFTVAEQRRASDAFRRVGLGLQNFTGTPRRLRLGVEVNF
jgi:carboxypeptidase family protein/TonB-dependent receptor-like protein